ncbi:NYN domain-containing protein [bacterium]|nr:NYN domain-containing protein [bacterium]
MQSEIKQYELIKELLDSDDLKSILVCALSHWNLAKLVNRLNLNPKNVKTTKIPTKNLAGLLAKGAFSKPDLFKEVGETLDLYSAEAKEAVKNSRIKEFLDSAVNKEKGHRKRMDTARLIWALLMDPSQEKRLEGKSMISELGSKKTHIDFSNSDKEDGDKTKDQYKAKRHDKEEQVDLPVKIGEDGINSNDRIEIKRLSNEVKQLKKEKAKLAQQAHSKKDAETIKNLEKRMEALDRKNRDLRERIEKEYISKDRFDALKKEKERLDRLYKSSGRPFAENGTEGFKPSTWKDKICSIIPFSLPRRLVRRGKNLRVGVFVDVQNMFYSAKNLYHGRLDFEKFLEFALQERKLVQATAYIVKTPEIDQSKFINLLHDNAYVVKTLDLKTGTNGYAKGNWDVGIAMDILLLADKVDVICLASGDGDFVPLVKHLQNKGIRVEVYGFSYNTAIDLKECADKFYPLQENILIRDQRGMIKQH